MKLSVAMCTYNGEKFLKEQLDSIINQTVKVDEIIVCDDISTDTTLQILATYNEEYPNLFKIYKNEINLKSVKNFEKAIGLCTGDIIFLSDQDDVWVLNKVEVYKNYFATNSRINVLASNGYCIDEQGKEHEKYAIWDVPQFLREKNIDFNYFELISYIANIATGASMAFRKKIVSDILPFPIIKDFHHDEWIAIMSSKKNSFELLNDKYFYYRIHENQQVGGVFYKKEENSKIGLTNLFNIHQKDTSASLVNIKRKLKKIVAAYHRNKAIIASEGKINNPIFYENLANIENLFYSTQMDMKSNYPIASFLLKISDKILNKRQLN